MAADKTMNYKFSWGDSVQIESNSPRQYAKIGRGSICGIREVESELVANQFEVPIGTILYLVESRDGNSVEIPEHFLTVID